MNMKNEKSKLLKMLNSLGHGDTIKYRVKGAVYPTYLVVSEAKDGNVDGYMVYPVGVNSIPVEKLLEMDEVSKASFRKYK